MNFGASNGGTTVTSEPIYLDNHATTRVDPRVAAVVLKAMTEQYGNPSSRFHYFGNDAGRIVDSARQSLAFLLNALPEEIVFASSATQALRLIIFYLAERRAQPLRIIATSVEHPALLKALKALVERGAALVTILPVNGTGQISLVDVELLLRQGCDLICVMAANNEVGTIYPVKEVATLAHEYGAEILVDASQAVGHMPVDVHDWKSDYFICSAHKLGGPKGIAAAVISTNALAPLRDLIEVEGGTLNVPAIAGFGELCRLTLAELPHKMERAALVRDRLQQELLRCVEAIAVNGDQSNRLCNNLHLSVLGIPSEAVVARLSGAVALSTGAACQAGTDAPSHVLTAMGLPPERVEGALRMAVGDETSIADIEIAARLIAIAVADIRQAINGA